MPELSKKECQRLGEAISTSRDRMEPFRVHRREAIRQFVGSRYSDDGSREPVPLNLAEMFITIVMQNLGANNPQVLITSDKMGMKAEAAKLELMVSKVLSAIDFANSLQDVIYEACFCLGVGKVGVTVPGPEDDYFKRAIGRPFHDCVTFDDLIIDMTARNWRQHEFIGNKYLAPFDWAHDNKEFDKEARRVLSPLTNTVQGEDGVERAEQISRGHSGGQDTFRDLVELEDIFIPCKNIILTRAADQSGGRVLKQREWDGPAGGPYHILGFTKVPSQLIPLSPIANLIGLHMLGNTLLNKAGKQAERQKTFYAAKMGATDDARKVQETSDGQIISMDNPGDINEIRHGGVDAPTIAFMLQVKQLFSWAAGNLDAMGGLGPMSDTATQDTMLTQSASRKIEKMQAMTVAYVRRVARDIAWYMHTDPLFDPQLVQRIPGVDIDIPVSYGPDDRRGDVMDFNFKIEPYSMAATPPSVRVRQLMDITERVILPNQQALMAEGKTFSITGLLKNIKRLTGIDEVDDLLTYASPVAGPEQEPMGKPANTTRTYERVNRPGSTRQQQDEATMALLMGQGKQPAEMASMVRNVG